MDFASVHSKMGALMLFIHCLLLLPLFVDVCVRSLFCFAVLCCLSSFAIIPLGQRELVALLFCVLNAMSLLSFFACNSCGHGLVCMQCVIVAFPGHTRF